MSPSRQHTTTSTTTTTKNENMQKFDTFVEMPLENDNENKKQQDCSTAAAAKTRIFTITPDPQNNSEEAGNENGCKTDNCGDECPSCKCFKKSEALEAFARRIRKKIHVSFYNLGYKIQSHNIGVGLLSCLLLVLCIVVPIKRNNGMKVETDIEDMWIASTGRLHDELQYSEKMTGRKGFQGEEEFGDEVLMQVVENEDQNILTSRMMLDHLNMVKAIKDMKSYTFGQEWTLRDICDRYIPPDFNVAARWLSVRIGLLIGFFVVFPIIRLLCTFYIKFLKLYHKAIDNMVPCHIMTPLDCFWEGSIIATYGPHYADTGLTTEETNGTLKRGYMKNNPQELIDYLKRGSRPGEKDMYKRVKRFVDKIGIGSGYMDRQCFSTDKCPSHKAVTRDIAGALKDGCYGVAKNYMYWPRDLLVSGMARNGTGHIIKSKAFQTVFRIKSPKNFEIDSSISRRFAAREFGHKEAAQIINDWKRTFTQFVNKVNTKKKRNGSRMLAFSTTSFKGMVKEFAEIDKNDTTYIGLALLTLYTIFTLKRWSSSIYSYGTIGLFGVGCAVMSVFAGLGLGMLANMNLTAISVQVLPFLALGLGLDNIFLLARTYVFVCDKREFKCNEIIGMCLGEVGLDITLASFTNTCAFMMASLVPIGAVQTFARQAAIIYGVNWFTVIFLFSSILAVDVVRQRTKHYDMLFCFKECHDEEELPEDYDNNNQQCPEVIQRLSMNIPGTTPDMPPLNANAKTQMTINPPSAFHQAYSNDDGEVFDDGGRRSDQNDQRLPPQQRPNFNLNRAKQARNYSGSRVFNVSQQDREERKRRKQKQKDNKEDERARKTRFKDFLFTLSLTYFAQRYYGKWLIKTSVKATVLVVCAAQLIMATYGVLKINKGLELADMLPKNTTQHQYMVERQKYFSYYKIYVATRNNKDGSLFDYANNQQLVYDLHEKLSKVKNMVHSPNNFWLPIYRDWIKEWHEELKMEWNNGTKHESCSNIGCDRETQKIFQLLSTSLPNTRYDMRTCKLPRQYENNRKKIQKDIVERTLVDRKGIINPKLFYLGLSLWHNQDSLGLWESEVEIYPEPEEMNMRPTCQRFPVEFQAAPQYISMGFQVHNLKTSDDYIQLIKDVREICEEFKKRGLYSYPTGIPFTYWEQFISLDSHLSVAVCVVLFSTFIISLMCLMNIKAAFFIVVFLSIILFEALGFIGMCNIQLSAISIIPLMMSMGTATQFVVHSVMAFINTPGNRNKRMRGSLEIMFASVFDCCMSSIIMISFLASSQYDFIVKYFFQLMLWIVLIAMVNTLLVLPVMLSLFGPCLEKINRHNAITPVQFPTYFLNFPGDIEEWHNVNYNRRNTLSTIPEESSCLNGDSNSRPGTPAYKSGHAVTSPYGNDKNGGRNSTITLNDYCDDLEFEDDEYSAETSFDNPSSFTSSRRAPTPAAWTHNPSACRQNQHQQQQQQNNRQQQQQQQQRSGRLPQTNYRDLPPNNKTTRGCHNTHNGRTTNRNTGSRSGPGNRRNAAPTLVQMRDNRVTTVKATFAMEVEISHPCTPSY